MNEIDRTRRRLLLGAAVTPIALAACGGGKGETSAGEAAPAASTPAAPPATTTPVAPPATTTPAPTPPEPPPATSTPVAAVAGKYRFQQPLLFQRAHQKWLPMKYTNSRGELVVLPSLDFHFGGYAATGTSGAMKAGSTPEVLCWLSKWRWRNTGGDWLDASLVSQGTTAWATSATLAGGTPAGEIELDVGALVRHADERKRWYAMFVIVEGSGTIAMVGPCNVAASKSVLEIVRAGQTETRDLWYACSLRGSTSATDAQDDLLSVGSNNKLALEFFRPGDQSTSASSAKLRLRHAGVTGGSVRLKIMLVDPDLPDITSVQTGIATSYLLDAGIFAHPDVAAAMRVTDTTQLADIANTAYLGSYNKPWTGVPMLTQQQEAYFDPAFWGTPGQGHLANVPAPTAAQKAMLLPHRNITPEGTRLQGAAWRSSAVGDSIRVVSGTELQARGLPVLAPGLGAFEMTYHGCRIGNGQAGANSLTTGGPLADGTAGNDLEMYFKPEHLGRVIDGYMRMYVMLGEGWEPKDSDMQWVWLDPKAGENAGKYPEEAGYTPQTVPWRVQDWTGKFPGGIQQVTSGGIPVPGYKYPTRLDPNGNADTTPVVLSAGGGYSNSSGLYGYQGRWMFSQGFYKENFQGPARDGAILGIELYDFGNQSAATSSAIPSQAHISSWDFNWQSYAGHRGGMGFLYTRRWYCVEMRWKMNSVKLPYAEPAPGTHYLESGFEVDGHIEWWIDGVKCAQTPAFAHRSSRMLDWMYQVARGVPFDTDPASPARLRPVTNVPPEVYMGATSAVLQTYYGGRAANPRDKKVLINGVVVTSGRYIGPMAGVSRDNGGLG